MRRFALAVGLVLALLGPAAQAQTIDGEQSITPHFVLSFGAGGAYDLFGFDFGLQLGHLEPFIGVGPITYFGGVMGGLRLVLHPDGGSSAFFSLQGGRLVSGLDTDLPAQFFEVALLAGYRARLGESAFVQIGAGPSLITNPNDVAGEAAMVPFFDIDLAIGVRF